MQRVYYLIITFYRLASELMFLSEKARAETVSWLGKKKLKYLFNVCSEMGSYILFILAPH